MNGTTNNKIEIKNLCKSFGNKIILNNLNLNIEKQKSLVILGKSGTGKSVLIKNISTLIKPNSGSIKIDGVEITNISENEQEKLMNKFGFLFQGGALFDSLTILVYLDFNILNNDKMIRGQAKDIAIEKLKIVGLDEKVAQLFPCELSGGMQKRAALARAIATNPEIIFFDEPTTGLDPIMSEVINDLIIKTTKITGATAITITHDIHSAKKISDRIVLLNEGTIGWDGTAEDLNTTDNKLIREFLNVNI